MPPVRVVAVVVPVMAVMAMVVVMTVMAVMVVVAVMVVMTVMTMMAATVHHMPAAAVTTTVAAAVTAGFSTGNGERRQADNNRCGKSEDCSALEHVLGSLVCPAGAHPRSRTLLSLKPRLMNVLAITRLSNPRRTGRGGLTIGSNGRICRQIAAMMKTCVRNNVLQDSDSRWWIVIHDSARSCDHSSVWCIGRFNKQGGSLPKRAAAL
jgi:hypothetical protein